MPWRIRGGNEFGALRKERVSYMAVVLGVVQQDPVGHRPHFRVAGQVADVLVPGDRKGVQCLAEEGRSLISHALEHRIWIADVEGRIVDPNDVVQVWHVPPSE